MSWLSQWTKSDSGERPLSPYERAEMFPYGLGVVFDPQRARNGITLTSHVFALRSITSESTPVPVRLGGAALATDR